MMIIIIKVFRKNADKHRVGNINTELHRNEFLLMSNFGNYNNPYGCTFNNDGWKRGYWDRNSYATEEEAHNAWRERRGYTPSSASGTSATSSTSGTNGGGSTNDPGSTASPSSARTTDRGSIEDPFYTDNGYEDIVQSEIDSIMGDPVNRNSLDGHLAEIADRNHVVGVPSTGNGESHGTHVVQRGESLWSIAKSLLGGNASNAEIQAKVKELAAMNGISNPNRIYPGQQINY